MLHGPEVGVTPLRPPTADELTQFQRLGLRQVLRAALAAWTGAELMGMQVGEIERATAATRPVAEEGAAAWRTDELALVLPRALAAALVCLSVGGQPDPTEGPLSELDLAVLDVWASQALAELAGRLGLEPTAVERGNALQVLADWRWPAVLAHLPSAAGEALVLIPSSALVPRAGGGGARGSDRLRLLHSVRVPIEVRLAGAQLPLADLIAAGPGDVVLIGRGAEAEVGLYVGGQCTAHGRPGVRSGRLAMRIERLEQEGFGRKAGPTDEHKGA